MRTYAVLVALGAFACSFGKAGAADAGFSDKICPEATQYVMAVMKLRAEMPAQKIYDTAQAAADAYAQCSKDKLANGFREPQHYADTRGGSFAVLAARALMTLNRPDDARNELQHWRPLVQQVVDWQAETETPHNAMRPRENELTTGIVPGGGGGARDSRASIYKVAAKDIVVAIDSELAKIVQQPRDVSRPQAASPAPSPVH